MDDGAVDAGRGDGKRLVHSQRRVGGDGEDGTPFAADDDIVADPRLTSLRKCVFVPVTVLVAATATVPKEVVVVPRRLRADGKRSKLVRAANAHLARLSG